MYKNTDSYIIIYGALWAKFHPDVFNPPFVLIYGGIYCITLLNAGPAIQT